MFLQRYVNRPLHSWILHLPSPTKCVPTKICQKATLPLTPNSPSQQKGRNKKTNKQKNPLWRTRSYQFPGSLSASKGSFSFLSNKSYLCAELVVPWVNSLPHKSILWLVKTRTFDTGRHQYCQLKNRIIPNSAWDIPTQKLLIVYLKFKFNWTVCILFNKSGNPM
jgi:hypothetical protein